MIRIPTHRAPTHPGEMLLTEFLEPMGIAQVQLAKAIRVPYQRVNELVNGRRGVAPSTALRLAKVLGTSPSFWMNLQQRWDLYHATKDDAEDLEESDPCALPDHRNLARSGRARRHSREGSGLRLFAFWATPRPSTWWCWRVGISCCASSRPRRGSSEGETDSSAGRGARWDAHRVGRGRRFHAARARS